MKWDIKIALYLFLAYAFYGITYLFSNGDYVVPLPMLFILIPIVSLFFLFTSGVSRYSIFFLLLPLGVMSDKINEWSLTISDIGSLLSVISWVVLGGVLFSDKQFKKQVKLNKLLYSFPLACVFSICFLLSNLWVNLSLFILLGVTSAILVREDGDKFNLPLPIRRLFIVTSFISWMYLITLLSVYLG